MKVERNVRKLKKLLIEVGWNPTDRGKGSHLTFEKRGHLPITVPRGKNGELKTGIARDIMKDAGLK